MKRRRNILIVTAMLTMLTACGLGGNHEGAGTQAGVEMSDSGAGTEGTVTGAGGGDVESVEHEYEKATLTYSEPAKGYAFRKDFEKTQTEYAAYYFEPSISSQERDSCIRATDRALSCIDASLPDIEVVVLEPESYDGVSVSGNRLYLPPQAWDSADYLAKVLLAGYGEWGNYGLAYGYADYLSRKAGLDSGGTDSEGGEAEGLLPVSTPELYDLNLLCFDERFASPEDVEAARSNACLFVEEYLSSHPEEELLELLSASGSVEGKAQAKEALEAFYAQKGVGCSLTGMRYQYGGVTYDYGAASEYARSYIEKDWQDWAWEEDGLSENFLHEDYGEVREFFEFSEQQMRKYQELFGFDSYDNDVPILFTNHAGADGVSYYSLGGKQIYLTSVESLEHEYIHFVMDGRCDWESPWKTEGFARYFSIKYEPYNYDAINDSWNSGPQVWVQEYIDTIGRPIDVQTDFPTIWHIAVHVAGLTDPDWGSGYTSGASFIGYLIEQYGEQAVIAYVCSDDAYNEEWGKSYDELVQDWNRYIEENYSQYSMEVAQR